MNALQIRRFTVFTKLNIYRFYYVYIKKYPKISCGAGILPAHNMRREQMPIPQDWIA